MSFNDLKVAELRKVADTFAVEVPPRAKKDQIIELLHDEGVTYAEYAKFADAEKDEPEEQPTSRRALVVESEDTILIRMERPNPSYQVAGVTFTQENPYAALPVSHAQEILDHREGGFVVATPREVQEFYS